LASVSRVPALLAHRNLQNYTASNYLADVPHQVRVPDNR
jgi:hypothetical protein